MCKCVCAQYIHTYIHIKLEHIARGRGKGKGVAARPKRREERKKGRKKERKVGQKQAILALHGPGEGCAAVRLCDWFFFLLLNEKNPVMWSQ